jgi:hypothetical protein
MVSNNIKNLSDLGPDQKKKTTEEIGDTTTGYENFEIFLDLLFIIPDFGIDRRCSWVTGSACTRSIIRISYFV